MVKSPGPHLHCYVHLLAVHLFSMIDSGEELLDSVFRCKGTATSTPNQLAENARAAARWIRLLEVLDPGLERELLETQPELLTDFGFSDEPGADRPIADIIHLAAQTLMGLEDRYGIFGLGDGAASVSDQEMFEIAPLLKLMELENNDADLTGPQPA